MEFIYGKQDWRDEERARENCYLITNGLGGYSSLTQAGACARNDHALLMGCVNPPLARIHLLSEMEEQAAIQNRKYDLSAQEYVGYTKNKNGFQYLNEFCFEHYPVWTYQVEGIEIEKALVMKHGSNMLGLRYRIRNHMDVPAQLCCKPWMQFTVKGERMAEEQKFITTKDSISSAGYTLYYKTNGETVLLETDYCRDFYYAHDARDGRECTGAAASTHQIILKTEAKSEKTFFILYSMEQIEEDSETVEVLFESETRRRMELAEQAEIRISAGKQLVMSADQFIVDRASTKEKSILAGYPFFGDWGRDTMIAVAGCCISTRRFEDARSIFRSFMKYCHKGIMPNMFPESGEEPMYNTADASLLFIGAVYEYYLESGDREFVQEAYPVMEEIIDWYQRGTDFHIKMDEDGLIQAGSGLEQVTWMDIRYEDILPTPRHGKPVEINAYWYNDLKIMAEFSQLFGRESQPYEELAELVKKNFLLLFWNEQTGCLRDVISGTKADDQIRCNQIWAVSLPYSVLDEKQGRAVVDKVFEKLYTPYGLRTLNREDTEYHAHYGGSQFERDMAYHQGTVWPFPMGAYYLAYLKVYRYSREAVKTVERQLRVLTAALREGCTGQLPEVYDGDAPAVSEGCFAQAWSVAELLRVYAAIQKAPV